MSHLALQIADIRERIFSLSADEREFAGPRVSPPLAPVDGWLPGPAVDLVALSAALGFGGPEATEEDDDSLPEAWTMPAPARRMTHRRPAF